MNKKQTIGLIIFGMILIAALSRLGPHLYNFTPIAAMALFGAAWFKNKWMALFVPLACLFFSDVLLQLQYLNGSAEYPAFFNGSIAVYGAFLLIGGLGFSLRNRVNFRNVVVTSITASILFFVVTNFAAWLTDYQYYPVKSFATLIEAYVAGIPFFRGTLLGDLFFNGVLFGSFELIRRNVPSIKLALAK